MVFILGKPFNAVYSVTACVIYGGLWGIGMRHLVSPWAAELSIPAGMEDAYRGAYMRQRGGREWGLRMGELRRYPGWEKEGAVLSFISGYSSLPSGPFFLTELTVSWHWIYFVFCLCLSIPTHLILVFLIWGGCCVRSLVF